MANCFAVTVVIVPYMSTSSPLFNKARDEVKCFKKTLFVMNMYFRKDEVYYFQNHKCVHPCVRGKPDWYI